MAKKINVNNIENLYIYTHRGEVGNLDKLKIGVHARIPLRFANLSSNELLVLSFIEIHQYMDQGYNIHGQERKPMPIKSIVTNLDMSDRTVKRVLRSLKGEGIIKEIVIEGSKSKSYITNVKKRAVKYQIFTFKFLLRSNCTRLSKDFLIRILMLNTDRIFNLGNITALSREIGMDKRTIKIALEDLAKEDFIKEVEPGIFGLNIKFIVEEFDKVAYDKFVDFKAKVFKKKDEEIVALKQEVNWLKARVAYLEGKNRSMAAIIKNLKK